MSRYRWVRLVRDDVVFPGSEHETRFTTVMILSDPVRWRIDKPLDRALGWRLYETVGEPSVDDFPLGLIWHPIDGHDMPRDERTLRWWAEGSANDHPSVTDDAPLANFPLDVPNGWHRPVKAPKPKVDPAEAATKAKADAAAALAHMQAAHAAVVAAATALREQFGDDEPVWLGEPGVYPDDLPGVGPARTYIEAVREYRRARTLNHHAHSRIPQEGQ